MSFSMVVEIETMFPTIGFLTWQIFGVFGSQIEITRIFSLVGILINLGNVICKLKI
jgi:hypothetical protein